MTKNALGDLPSPRFEIERGISEGGRSSNSETESFITCLDELEKANVAVISVISFFCSAPCYITDLVLCAKHSGTVLRASTRGARSRARRGCSFVSLVIMIKHLFSTGKD